MPALPGRRVLEARSKAKMDQHPAHRSEGSGADGGGAQMSVPRLWQKASSTPPLPTAAPWPDLSAN